MKRTLSKRVSSGDDVTAKARKISDKGTKGTKGTKGAKGTRPRSSNHVSVDTPREGWDQSYDVKESLPIKRLDGKVIPVRRIERNIVNDNNLQDASEGSDVDSIEKEGYSEDSGDENDELTFHSHTSKSSSDKAPKTKQITVLTPSQKQRMKGEISLICIQITADPETSLKKRRPEKADGTMQFGMNDLLRFLQVDDPEIAEIAQLSTLLVFKDIAPGYRIRQKDESKAQEQDEPDVKLKKDTQRIRDFEISLLAAYQRYLHHLDAKIKIGLGNPKHEIKEWTPEANLGLSALRCQCELLKWLSYFNFRGSLINSVVIRAAQCNEDVSSLCSQTLNHIFSNDKDFELSYETVCIIAKVLVAFKFDASVGIISCLKTLKITVHADDAKSIRLKSKKERRKRKRSQDDVEKQLMEGNAIADKTLKQRFQVDTLQEVAMIYFRIIKQKIGFKLLPAALDGLGAITHLINFDMVEDLIPVIKEIVKKNPPVPLEVKLLCIHCVLRTLLGPGEELKADDEVFVVALRDLLADIPLLGFDYWNKVLEAIEMLLLKRRETRNSLIFSLVHRLLLWAGHLQYTIASSVLTLVHAIFLRYPKIRLSLKIFTLQSNCQDDEDQVEDFAMKALRESNASKANEVIDGEADVSRLLILLRHHTDLRIRRIVATMMEREAAPLPYRLIEAKTIDEAAMVDMALKSMASISPTHPLASKMNGNPKSMKSNSSHASVKARSTNYSDKALLVVPSTSDNFWSTTQHCTR